MKTKKEKTQETDIEAHEFNRREKAYVAEILRRYICGEDNAFEVYNSHYAFRLLDYKESDVDFITRCAILDFADGPENLVYLDVYEELFGATGITLTDGDLSVELDKDDMDLLFGAVEDYDDKYRDGRISPTREKLGKVYHRKGSIS